MLGSAVRASCPGQRGSGLCLTIPDDIPDHEIFAAELQPGQQAEVDAMVNNLLHWIQGFYQQRNRKARQYFGGKPERPRPFEPASYLPPVGYPPAGSRPTPAYDEGPSASPGYQPSSPSPSQPSFQPSQSDQVPYQPSQAPYLPSKPFQPSVQPSQPTQSSYQPSQPSETPFTTSQAGQSFSPSYQPSQPSLPPYSGSPSTDPSFQVNQPTQPSYQPSQPSYQPSEPTFQPSQPTYQPSQPAYQPSQPSYQPSQQPSYQPSQPSLPNSSPYQPSQPSFPEETTLPPYNTPQQPEEAQTDSTKPDIANNEQTTAPSAPDDDDRHPPHIHAITVDCGKEMMTINIEFNKVYNGIIYSQDHYNDPECVYVRENSNQIKYSFTVSLNTCGTRFFSDFENEGQAYLENVLVLQNEVGIQEVWDQIRRVRCLWQGNLTKQLVSSLSVGMLNQVISNFSGDTAMARLDIQTGKGPFAPEANGLIKIGETMTLVVSVTGDAGFDILVRECIARDSGSRHVVPLTDSNGCILKPKLFGAFQKTRDTGNTGASIIAYAYFNAFKFPDEMDLIIQCEVELCKTDCEACPNPGSLEPKRRRRDVIHIGNRTVEPVTTIGKGLRVVFAEDLPQENPGFCISPVAAMWGSLLVLGGSLMSSLAVTLCWQRSRGSMKFS
ncbi:DNA-directed RNA polymerase II subunit RPB1 [Papilio machaon]|uniref:DNA-directed RNA polymerase II subunit RPB1 n=1 Tax=Papilio machaon TaxID=76193 RepID=A0A0N1IQM6_PAPMA|nr:DNA-directed RNA polymerase II subunit RPB1 [Papilio machaon]